VLHLHWVKASDWALPDLPIHVVDAVWTEIARHGPTALANAQLVRVSAPALPTILADAPIDAGEREAIAYALQRPSFAR
jgi:hypothetical protein